MKYSAFILILLLGLWACEADAPASQTETQSRPILVRVKPVLPASQAQALFSSGRVAAQEEIKLAFKIGGVIRAMYAQEGSWVKRGQVLARLDPAEINAQVKQAQTALEKARRDLARVERLYADTVTTLEQVQDLRSAQSVAEANLNIAQFNQRYATIVAPVSGRILKRFGEQGEIIGPGNPVYYLAATQSAQVIRIGLADVEVVQVRLGDTAHVRFDAWPGERFRAKVSEIAAGANPMNGTFEVELQLLPHPKPIKNGFIGKVALYPSPSEGLVQVPIDAVVEADAQYARIFVPKGSGVVAHELRHFRILDDVLILPASELDGVKEVITDGARYLTPESQIQQVSEANRTTELAENRQ